MSCPKDSISRNRNRWTREGCCFCTLVGGNRFRTLKSAGPIQTWRYPAGIGGSGGIVSLPLVAVSENCQTGPFKKITRSDCSFNSPQPYLRSKFLNTKLKDELDVLVPSPELFVIEHDAFACSNGFKQRAGLCMRWRGRRREIGRSASYGLGVQGRQIDGRLRMQKIERVLAEPHDQQLLFRRAFRSTLTPRFFAILRASSKRRDCVMWSPKIQSKSAFIGKKKPSTARRRGQISDREVGATRWL
jgi:hypothetical protein